MLQLNRHLSELWHKCDPCSGLVPAVKKISSKHLLLKKKFSTILSFLWLENLNVRNWTNGSLVARVFGILGMKLILDFIFCSSDQTFGQKKDRNVSCSLAFGRRRVKERLLGESFESHSFISDLPISNIH